MNAVTQASVEASILCTLITQPIWVIKTRMLLNTNPKISEYQNFKRQVKEVYSHYGLKGALRGLELSLILSFSGVIQMYVYEGSKILFDRLKLPESRLGEKHFICGSLSKIFSILLSYPITTLRTRIQQSQFVTCSSDQKYKSLRDLAGRTWREEGVRGLYKGMNANLMKGMSQKGIYFYFYEIFKQYLFPSLQEGKIY
ncbi:uncharacterized protein LOC116244728 [Nymphaea colorata]|nr:uncharacterized protein LOC116244728 [Nymphaea colorata]